MVRICKIEDLKGNEVLAKQILSKDLQVLLEKGETIQPKQIARLKDFDIEEVFILEKEVSKEEKIVILKEETKELIKENMKEIMEKLSNGNPLILEKVTAVAEQVIDNVFQIDEVTEKVYEIKEHNADLYEHAVNVCSLSVILAIRLNCSKSELNDIAIGALIHDIGLQSMERYYVDINLNLIGPDQIVEYRKHPAYGYSKIEEESWLPKLSKDIILYHHERIDGSGFPTRISDIEPKIQIVQVCDCFDEMVNGIGYVRRKIHEAIGFLRNSKDIKYSEKIVDAFINFIAVYPIGSIVLTNEKEVGVVIRQNRQYPDRPVIKILKDKQGNVRDGVFVKDLLQENTVFIEKQL